ncbi:hypothetical protein ISF62_18305 [Burkholderia pseudomallei]|nr:hypothetical protein [Burkholderia pseudomallei]MBF3820811.1 hypothetical protein [Burkholderia pseudomallei]
MKVYLIDPYARTVSEGELAALNELDLLRSIYALLKCETIEAVRPLNSGVDIMYVDEDGLAGEQQAFFFCRLFPQVIAGRALWIGTTPDGGNCSPEMTLEYVRDHVVWNPSFDPLR